MTEIDIHVSDVEPTDATIARVDAAVAAHGLIVTMKGHLKTYPGSTHWHCKLGREPGTLEITLWPAKRRLWFKIHPGRRGEWMTHVLPSLQRALETVAAAASSNKGTTR
jgi:hypothetical protein